MNEVSPFIIHLSMTLSWLTEQDKQILMHRTWCHRELQYQSLLYTTFIISLMSKAEQHNHLVFFLLQ